MDTSIARRSDGKLIRAAQGIDKSLPFNCPGCKQEVYAATEGKIQRPHFRHKSIDGSKGCSDPESYIHWITKELFADFFKSIDSLYIEIPHYLYCTATQTCKKRSSYQLDLKEKFPHIIVEEYHQGFRPDCMLFNDAGEKLYLEVKYTHAVSEEKIDTGVPIIELSVSNEKDIDKVIKSGKIATDIINYKIYNNTSLLLENLTFDCRNRCLKKSSIKQNIHSASKKQKFINENPKERSYWGSIYHDFAKWSNSIKDERKNTSVSNTIEKLNQNLKQNKRNDKQEPKKDSESKQMTFDFD
jgi:hypothetical protein